MKTILLAAGAAAIALSAGLACAQTVPGPKQPIPYAQLGAYMKASPRVRASKDWSSGQAASAATTTAAATGASANTSATVPSPSPSLPADTAGAATSVNPPSLGGETKEAAPQLPSTPAIDAPSASAVNPPATATPGAPASTPPK
jgi:hypothetical protein